MFILCALITSKNVLVHDDDEELHLKHAILSYEIDMNGGMRECIRHCNVTFFLLYTYLSCTLIPFLYLIQLNNDLQVKYNRLYDDVYYERKLTQEMCVSSRQFYNGLKRTHCPIDTEDKHETSVLQERCYLYSK